MDAKTPKGNAEEFVTTKDGTVIRITRMSEESLREEMARGVTVGWNAGTRTSTPNDALASPDPDGDDGPDAP